MNNNYPPGPETPTGFNLWGMLAQLGFPNPDAVLQEIQRLNSNLEQLAPGMGLLAQLPTLLSDLTAAVNPEDLHSLAEGLKKLDPQQVQELTAALKQASETGEKFAGRLWPAN